MKWGGGFYLCREKNIHMIDMNEKKTKTRINIEIQFHRTFTRTASGSKLHYVRKCNSSVLHMDI